MNFNNYLIADKIADKKEKEQALQTTTEYHSLLQVIDYVRESNKIEGIERNPTVPEVEETYKFINLDEISIGDVCHLVSVYQKNAKLRIHSGMNVSVGNYHPPSGGQNIVYSLDSILKDAHQSMSRPDEAWDIHCRYETLHPFTDGNGRSGRALWLWQMNKNWGMPSMPFLQWAYYQSLNAYHGHRQA